jgi:hypothetical protein
MAENPRPELETVERLTLRDINEALGELWRNYHWPIKIAVAVVIVQGLWGAIVSGWPQLGAALPPIATALLSTSAQYLVTLIIAFFVLVNFYIRAQQGKLDGDEHYNIARALAFGYFTNFLVPALILAGHHDRRLVIFRPDSMADLAAYSRVIEPRVRKHFDHDWLPVVDQPTAGGPPRRTVLALQTPRSDLARSISPFYFDAPTALFTVSDFYGALNRRRADSGKKILEPDTVMRFQNGQIDSFFTHLDLLFRAEEGLAAVADLVPDLGELANLRGRLHEAGLGELESQFPS